MSYSYLVDYWLGAMFQIFRPEGIITGNKTFRHIHDNMRRPRDGYRYGDQKAVSGQLTSFLCQVQRVKCYNVKHFIRQCFKSLFTGCQEFPF